MIAILEEDEDLLAASSIDAVYIPPLVDEHTNEEDLHDNICEDGTDLPDLTGTYEILISLRDTPEDLDNECLPST